MAKDKAAHDTPVMFGLIILTVVLVCILFWMTLQHEISSGIRWIRVAELRFASLFTHRYDKLIDQLMALKPGEIRPIYLLKMTQATGEFYRIPIVILMGLMSVIAFFRKSKHPFARRLDMEGLTKEQAAAFPVTAPIVKFNPLTANFRAPGSPVPEKLPPFAEALSPDEWVSFNSIPIKDGVIDRDTARLAFAKQLGGRWKNVGSLPVYMQALFAAFSMKANGQRTESDDFLGHLSQCWEPGRGLILTPELRKQIKKVNSDPKMGRVTEKVAAQHAFINPAMLRCLHMAREQGGVLAPAQFIWLRAVDRQLWYALNNLGRGATHIEGSGAISHYRAEKSAGKPIPNPLVDPAIDGLMGFLKDNLVTQFPAKEYARK